MNLGKIGAAVRKLISISGIKPSYHLGFINGLLKLGYWKKNKSKREIND